MPTRAVPAYACARVVRCGLFGHVYARVVQCGLFGHVYSSVSSADYQQRLKKTQLLGLTKGFRATVPIRVVASWLEKELCVAAESCSACSCAGPRTYIPTLWHLMPCVHG